MSETHLADEFECPAIAPSYLRRSRVQTDEVMISDDDTTAMASSETSTHEVSYARQDEFLNTFGYLVVSQAIQTLVMTRIYQMFRLELPTIPQQQQQQQQQQQFRFPGPMPVSMMRSHIESMRADEYFVSPKTNGTRSYLLLLKIEEKPHVFLINRRMRVMLIPGFGTVVQDHLQNSVLRGKEDPTALFDGTLLDGDVVRQHKTGRFLYVPHDIICTTGKDLTQMAYEQRLCVLNAILQQRLLHCSNKCPFELRQKPIVSMRRCQWVMTECIPGLDYDSDGVLFTYRKSRVETGTSRLILKWKDKIEHTTDLRARIRVVAPVSAVTSLPDPRDVVVQLFMSGGPNPVTQPITTEVMLAEQSLTDTFGRALCATPVTAYNNNNNNNNTLGTTVMNVMVEPGVTNDASSSNKNNNSRLTKFLQDSFQAIAWKDASLTDIPHQHVRPDAMQFYMSHIDAQISEFYYNDVTKLYHFKSVRDEKEFPNTYKCVAWTQENVREDVRPVELWQLADRTALSF